MNEFDDILTEKNEEKPTENKYSWSEEWLRLRESGLLEKTNAQKLV